jgi:hypothetical protein
MIEVIFLFVLCSDIGRIARQNGRSAFGFQCLLVCLWFLGEIIGLLLGAQLPILMVGLWHITDVMPWTIGPLVYVFGLMCAICGSILAFRIARHASPVMLPAHLPRGFEGSALNLDEGEL